VVKTRTEKSSAQERHVFTRFVKLNSHIKVLDGEVGSSFANLKIKFAQ
jgi:hypothetical protein